MVRSQQLAVHGGILVLLTTYSLLLTQIINTVQKLMPECTVAL